MHESVRLTDSMGVFQFFLLWLLRIFFDLAIRSQSSCQKPFILITKTRPFQKIVAEISNKEFPWEPQFLLSDVRIDKSVVEKLTVDFRLKFQCFPVACLWSRMEIVQPAIFQLSTNTRCCRTINTGIFMHM
jgi:hypothetical protein